jgi:LemA protein
MLTQALGKLFALAEAYPDLKANENFLQLQDQLADVENKIAAARRFYNNAAQEYNTAREQFPAVLVAGPFGFQEREFFEAPEGREALQEPVEVDFS